MSLSVPRPLLDALGDLDQLHSFFDNRRVSSSLDKVPSSQYEVDEKNWYAVWAERAIWEVGPAEFATNQGWGNLRDRFKGMAARFGCLDALSHDLFRGAVAYWERRAVAVNHPVLRARYADAAWHGSKLVLQARASIEYARLAIDAYKATASFVDAPSHLYVIDGIGHALAWAMRIGDQDRVTALIATDFEYVERTAKDDLIGTYTFIIDHLTTVNARTEASKELLRAVEFVETRFRKMMMANSEWDVDPHTPLRLAQKLAEYYGRSGQVDDRRRVLSEAARVFERRAKLADPLIGMDDLNFAERLYRDAGIGTEAERVHREIQLLGPLAVKRLVRHEVAIHISPELESKFKTMLASHGTLDALQGLTEMCVPNQAELAARENQLERQHPLTHMFKSTLLGKDHIVADLGNTNQDPDGDAVWRTRQDGSLSFSALHLRWGFDYLFGTMGLTADRAVAFVAESRLFESGRASILLNGVQAHMDGDYLKSVHILIPQIEMALVNLLFVEDGSSIKPHRTGGPAVMLHKSINDALMHPEAPGANKAAANILGHDRRVYLLAMLAHQKGLNIRHKVCHGLCEADFFRKELSERVLHCLFVVALVRRVKM